MKPYTIPLFLTEIIIFATLIYIFIKARKTKVSISFILFLTNMLLWMNTTFLLHNIPVSPFTFFLLRTSSVFTFLLGFFTLNFVYAFLNKRPDLPYKIFLFLSLFSIVIYNFTNVIVDFSKRVPNEPQYINSLHYVAKPYGSLVLKVLFVLAIILPVIYSFYIIYRHSKTEDDPDKKSQLNIFLIGGITTLSIGSLLTILMNKYLTPQIFILLQMLSAISIVFFIILGMKKFGFLVPSIEAFSEEVFNNAQDGIIVLTPKRRVVSINKVAKKWLGLEGKEVEGIQVERIIKECNKDEKNFEIRRGGRIFTIKKIPIEDNRLIGIVVMIIDVTEERKLREELLSLNAELQERVTERTVMLQKTVEELQQEMDARLKVEKELRETMNLYKTLFESGGDAIFFHDSEGYIINVNKKASELLQMTKDEIIGLNIFNIIEFFSVDKEGILKRPEMKKDLLIEGKVKIDKTTNDIYIEANIKRIIVSGEEYYLVFARDVSHRKEAEKRLLELSRFESMSLFAGGIAHDFNNMLTAIFGNLSILKLKFPNEPELHKRIERVESILDEARSLSSQLLSLSKGGEPIKEVTTIRELLIDTIEFALRGLPIKLKLDIPQDLPPIDIDKGQISRVIQNIIANAIDVMRDGGTLTVKVEVLEVPPDKKGHINTKKALKISISDTGPGIPKDLISHIFEPFFTTKSKGSGLGLATSYMIIKKHRGYMEVSSKEGEGTTFYIWLPITGEEKEDPKELDGKQEIKEYSEGAKILIMDDEEMIRDFLKDTLQMHEYEVDVARDGEEAIEKYKEAIKKGDPFDLVIMDLTIPDGMGGKETIKFLREIDPNVSAIVSSGYTDTDVLIRYRDYGFSGYLRKPYTLSELFILIGEILQEKNKQQF